MRASLFASATAARLECPLSARLSAHAWSCVTGLSALCTPGCIERGAGAVNEQHAHVGLTLLAEGVRVADGCRLKTRVA